jgi:flagellar biosynthesis/type III secretory pathway protein FliH
MILRDPTFDEQVRTIQLSRARASSPLAAAVVVLDEEPVTPVRETLTFEAVAAWLAVQDEPTRNACASILSDELTHVHETARIDGRALGEAQGRDQAQQACQRVLDGLAAIAKAAEEELTQEHSRLADLCAEIVGEALAKIAGPLLSTRKAAIGAVTEVLRRVKEGRDLAVRVSPADLPILQQEEQRLAAVVPGRALKLVADARIELGGCIVESSLGALDGRLDVQLRELYATLRAARTAAPERS